MTDPFTEALRGCVANTNELHQRVDPPSIPPKIIDQYGQVIEPEEEDEPDPMAEALRHAPNRHPSTPLGSRQLLDQLTAQTGIPTEGINQ